MLGGYAAVASGTVTIGATGLVALVSLLTFLTTALVVSPLAAVAVVLAALALSFLLRPVRSATRRSAGRAAAANLDLATDVAEVTSHALELRIFEVEPAVGSRLSDRIDAAAHLNAHTGFLNSLAPIVYQGSAMLFLTGAIALLYLADVTELGAVGGVVLIMLRSLSFGQTLQTSYQNLHQSAPQLEVLRDELARYEATRAPRAGAHVGHIGELRMESVSFEYEPGIPVLRDLSFRVPHGEIIGVIGPSGAGKSTLVQLILRLRDPTRGEILADGRSISSLSLDEWYERVSFVPQDPALFAGSIAENIRFYRDDVGDAEIELAARRANLHEEVMAWPRGYETMVGERGGQLSGGERQRLCIARALVEEPEVIVFDEPTSSLDVRSEVLIRDSIAGLAPRSTVFVIAHRLSTLTTCHRIMVLSEGRLHGFDEPSRLETSNPFYREALALSGLR
jgi:ABC-type multidrug transport system fused ATPase/permease subunit